MNNSMNVDNDNGLNGLRNITECIPMINGSLIRNNIGKKVSFVGKFIKANNNIAIFESSDKKNVNIKINSNDEYAYETTWIQIIGSVNNDLSISQQNVILLSNEFNIDNYDQMVYLSSQYNNLF